MGVMERNEQSPAVKAFLNEIADACHRHGLSLSHEDSQGAFIVRRWSAENIAWLKDATDETVR